MTTLIIAAVVGGVAVYSAIAWRCYRYSDQRLKNLRRKALLIRERCGDGVGCFPGVFGCCMDETFAKIDEILRKRLPEARVVK